MPDIGTFGMGVVGVFNRTLPPRAKTNYDPAYELALEVQRWFHYRHSIEVLVPDSKIADTATLENVMERGYRTCSGRRSGTGRSSSRPCGSTSGSSRTCSRTSLPRWS